MWDRKVLKARGKAAFRANYWISVLMAVILMFAAGASAGSAAGPGFSFRYNMDESDYQDFVDATAQESFQSFVKNPISAFAGFLETVKNEAGAGTLALFLVFIFGAVAVAGAVGLVMRILLFNPIQVGCQYFFIRNSAAQGAMSNLGRAFKPNWRGNVKTMFLRDLFLLLWGLLLFIPAIIKAYSYRMVPYILADHPEMSGTEVITLSRQMMDGNKWRTFVLDLSFIGWDILSGLTLGILGLFYVNPYKCSTDAELYQTLKMQIQG